MICPYFKTLYLISICIFAIEFFLRVFVERRLSFLISIDGLVLINQVFFSVYDLRILRLFRLFDIFSQSRFLLPTNTLIKTIIKQRNALLGSQIMVISILLVVSTFIYFLRISRSTRCLWQHSIHHVVGHSHFNYCRLWRCCAYDRPWQVVSKFYHVVGIGMFALPAAILASAYYEEIQKKNFLVSFEAIASVPLFQELPIGAVGKINEKLQVVLVSEHETIFLKGRRG